MEDLAQELADQLTGLATRAGQLQLSICGHLVALPSSRAVAAALLVIASARLLPAFFAATKVTGAVCLALIWFCLEIAFYVYMRPRLQRGSQPAPVPEDVPEDLHKVFRERMVPAVPLEEHLAGWFHDAPLDLLRRGNVQDYVSYITCYREYDDLPARAKAEVDATVDDLERRLGLTLPEGRDGSLRYMAHLFEPLRCVHLPLACYALAEATSWAADLVLWCMGFSPRRHAASGMRYWVWNPEEAASTSAMGVVAAAGRAARLGGRLRAGLSSLQGAVHDSFGSLADLVALERYAARANGGERRATPLRHQATATAAAHPPIVFVHGVMGLVLCLTLIKKILDRCNRHPIVLLDVRSVTMRLCRRAQPFDDVAAAAVGVLAGDLGYRQACFVGHSYGTFVMSRIYKMFPEVVHSMVLLEPVALLPCWPSLLRNFVYRIPRPAEAATWRGLVRTLRSVLSREVTMAETFCRHFRWHELILWPGDLPPNSLVVLSEEDDLVPSGLVRAHLQHGGLPPAAAAAGVAAVCSAASTAAAAADKAGAVGKVGKRRRNNGGGGLACLQLRKGGQPGGGHGPAVLYREGAAHGDVLVSLAYQDDVADAMQGLLHGAWSRPGPTAAAARKQPGGRTSARAAALAARQQGGGGLSMRRCDSAADGGPELKAAHGQPLHCV